MSDEDTKRHRRRLMMSDDERAMLDSARRRHTSPFGVPVSDEPADVTPVFDVLEDSFRARRPDAPVTAADLEAFAVTIRGVVRKLRDDGVDSERRVAAELRELIAHPPNEAITALRQDMDEAIDALRTVARRVDQQGQHVATHQWLVKLIGGGLASAIVAVGVFLYTRGASDGAGAVRLDHVERRLDAIDRAVDEVRRAHESSFQPGYGPAPTNKDKTP